MGIGKSTLVRHLLTQVHSEVDGFFTVKHGSDVFLYNARDYLKGRAKPQCIGRCDCRGKMTAYASVFDAFGEMIGRFPAHSLIVMDELGFMERDAKAFCDAVLKVMADDHPVLAVVKAQSSPFLDAVRNQDEVMLCHLTAENRDAHLRHLNCLIQNLAW
jgi:nucleoside-triphosphatase